MKQVLSCLSVMLFGMFVMTSCSKEVVGENGGDEGVANSRLSIVTRSVDDEEGEGGTAGTVAYPVYVYVFNAEDACVSRSIIESDESPLTLNLSAGSYKVCAVGATDDDRYTLPSQEAATLTTLIKPKENKVLDDLMTAYSTVTIGDNETAQLTLSMVRKVAMLKNVYIRNVPADVTAVGVTVTPLHQSVELRGDYDDSNEGSASVTLTQQESSSTWASAQEQYLFPSVGEATITIRMTNGEGETNSYIYTYTDGVEANHKYTLDGTYSDGKIAISGHIAGATWGGDKTITFEFEGAGSTPSTPEGGGSSTPATGSVPEVGTLYQGCYVLSVTENTATVLSSKQQNELIANGESQSSVRTKINAALSTWSVDGITSTWRLPNKAEAQTIFNARSSISSTFITFSLSANQYFMEDENTIKRFTQAVGSNTFQMDEGMAKTNYLCPVTTITFQ